jgi:hypothetical protein
MTTMATTMIRRRPVSSRPTTSSPTPALVHGDQIADDHDGCAVESGDEYARTQSERLAGDALAHDVARRRGVPESVQPTIRTEHQGPFHLRTGVPARPEAARDGFRDWVLNHGERARRTTEDFDDSGDPV